MSRMVGRSWRWNPPTHPTTPLGNGLASGGLFYARRLIMHTWTVVLLVLAAACFGINAWVSKSLLALGLLAWVLALLVPMLVS